MAEAGLSIRIIILSAFFKDLGLSPIGYTIESHAWGAVTASTD